MSDPGTAGREEMTIASTAIGRPGGLELVVLDRGASLQSLTVPAAGGAVNVVLGHARAEDYLGDEAYLGATVGRYANRIAFGRCPLEGKTLELATDPRHGPHCLHGGPGGLHTRRFALSVDRRRSAVSCRYRSPDGAQGFPGNLELLVKYQLLDRMTLALDYVATSDAPTLVNLANHAYFNLDGDAASIADHRLSLHCEDYTPSDPSGIPTGSIASVAGSRFDLRRAVRLGDREGYDQNFVVAGTPGRLRPAARVRSPASGIGLELETTQPGLQLYTGGGLGAPFRPAAGLCLEAQNFPDAPNRPAFPSALLKPGETYRQRSVYRFSVGERH